MKPDNPQAFPSVTPEVTCYVEQGMTLRDYFAAKAMQGMITGKPGLGFDLTARQSYQIADAMLKEREND